MPEEGVQLSPNDKLLNTNEIKRLAALFVKALSVRKIRLTGGEPLIRKDLVQIVEHLNELRSDGLRLITMTTNATVLKRNCSLLRNAGKRTNRASSPNPIANQPALTIFRLSEQAWTG